MSPRPTASAQLADYVANFCRRILADALLEATSAYWLRRAATFATVGNPRCDEVAEACRNHAELLRMVGLDDDAEAIIADALASVVGAAA